jgi:hypothetical protein
MPNTFYPTNIGYLPTGVAGVSQVSSIYLGRNVASTYEGVGFGAGGRPDYAELVQINLTIADNPLFTKATITMDVNDLVNIVDGPSVYEMTLQEITVCDNGTSRRAVVLMSQLYD